MASVEEDRDAQADALYALPLDEFTAARDELARRLRRAGERDGAAEVKRLRKPSVAAWALNQVRRNDPGRADELLEAGRRLREAQERLLAGGGREPLQEAAGEERRLVGELAREAERELSAAGRPVTEAVTERLRATLHAVASDPEAREGLAAGRLVRDHEASGLGPLAAGPAGRIGEDRGRPPSKAAGARREATSAPQRKAGGAIQRRARRLEERLERARARRRELEEGSAEAGRRLSEARREAARAAAALEKAEAAEERARGRAAEAARTATKLERELRELTARRVD
jgi:hypothetical protein